MESDKEQQLYKDKMAMRRADAILMLLLIIIWVAVYAGYREVEHAAYQAGYEAGQLDEQIKQQDLKLKLLKP